MVCLEKPKITKFFIRRKTFIKSHKLNHIKLVNIYFFLPLLQSYIFYWFSSPCLHYLSDGHSFDKRGKCA